MRNSSCRIELVYAKDSSVRGYSTMPYVVGWRLEVKHIAEGRSLKFGSIRVASIRYADQILKRFYCDINVWKSSNYGSRTSNLFIYG